MKALLQMGVTSYFFIAGIAAVFFNPDKKSFIGFTIDKVMRLVIPMVACIFIFLIPRLYVSQEYDVIGRVKGPEGPEIEWNFIRFVPRVLASNIVMKFG